MKKGKKTDATIEKPVIPINKTFTVTYNGKIIGTYNYLDEVTVVSPNNTFTGFLINGNMVRFGTNLTFYVTDNLNITTDRDAEHKNAALLNLIDAVVLNNKVYFEFLCTANVKLFARMGIAYTFSERNKLYLADAVNNVNGKSGYYNNVGVHFSNVDSMNKSGQYQFRYSPGISINNIDDEMTLYFYTFAETERGMVISEPVQVVVSDLIA